GGKVPLRNVQGEIDRRVVEVDPLLRRHRESRGLLRHVLHGHDRARADREAVGQANTERIADLRAPDAFEGIVVLPVDAPLCSARLAKPRPPLRAAAGFHAERTISSPIRSSGRDALRSACSYSLAG